MSDDDYDDVIELKAEMITKGPSKEGLLALLPFVDRK